MDTLIFKDSINFFASSLAGLPAMFGFRETKGHFPHRLNRWTNMGMRQIGLPPLEDYEPDRQKPAERENLLRWWHENQYELFDLCSELVKYCKQDVNVLRHACVAYRSTVLETANMDPFLRVSTQAGLSLNVFLRRHMTPRTIVNMPETGMRLRDRQSIVAQRYFRTYEALNPTVRIRDASWVVGESRFQDRKRVDGVVGFVFLIDRNICILNQET